MRHGYSDAAIAAHLAASRWQQPARGIYLTYTGPPTLAARQWVALIHGGPRAVLSHQSAGVLWRIVDAHDNMSIHVTVPRPAGARSIPGVIVHRSRRQVPGVLSPPRTPAVGTVFDLASRAESFEAATALIARACQLQITTPMQLRGELLRRKTQRWRGELLDVMSDVEGGVHSVLELRYLRDVERAHRIPSGARQFPAGGTRQDVHYREFRTVIELDGRLNHADLMSRWRDMTRDNASISRGEVTLRYGWADVAGSPCAVASQVATVLAQRGWEGKVRRCGPQCTISS